MSDSTLDNDDLSSTQELVIAGIVILFFGFLYWFLNTDESIQTNLEATNTEIPKTSSSVITSKNIKALNSPAPIQEVTTTSTAEVIDGTHQEATTQKASIPQPKEESNEPTLAEIIAETQPTPEQPKTLSAEAVLPEAPIAPTKPEAPVAPKEPIAKENPAEQESEKSATEETAASTPQNSLYTLPDGSDVEIASNGFENTFKQAILSKTHNKPIIFDNIYFHSGSAKVKTTSDHQLKATVALLHKHPQINILLRGHTDNTGDIKSNSELSLNRANATGLALAALGINGERIRIEGMGDTNPISSNKTEEGRKQNRRIELLIIK